MDRKHIQVISSPSLSDRDDLMLESKLEQSNIGSRTLKLKENSMIKTSKLNILSSRGIIK